MKAVRLFSSLVLAALLAVTASAEEVYLKNGTRLVGELVALDGKVFKLRTRTGVLLVEKSEIRRILFEQDSETGRLWKPLSPLDANEALLQSRARLVADPLLDAPPPFDPVSWARGQATYSPLTRGIPPLDLVPPRPLHVEETARGTLYVNHSFGFRLYKPPTWLSYPQLVQPETQMIAALGTMNESTLLLVGWEYYETDLVTYARMAEESLQSIYTDYRNLGEGPTRVAGYQAYQRRFVGQAQGRYWTGWSVYISRGSEHFTFLGLTSAGQFTSIQEVVLQKVLNSLRFEGAGRGVAATSGR